jgi:opacity protein-like surface antigen
MKRLSIALAAAFAIGAAAPAVAADYIPPPPPPTCADYGFFGSIWCYVHGPGPYHHGR